MDVNHDGVLDYRDEELIGKSTFPDWTYGSSINLKYKNFDLQGVLQGAFDYDSYTNLFQGGLNYSQAIFDNRWNPQNNNANAVVPRINGAGTNSSLASDYYDKKTWYLRLKTFALGYNLPHNFLSKAGIKNARFYVAGTNLLTINPLSKYDIDPEAPSGNGGYYYPQQRTMSIGLNVTL